MKFHQAQVKSTKQMVCNNEIVNDFNLELFYFIQKLAVIFDYIN